MMQEIIEKVYKWQKKFRENYSWSSTRVQLPSGDYKLVPLAQRNVSLKYMVESAKRDPEMLDENGDLILGEGRMTEIFRKSILIV